MLFQRPRLPLWRICGAGLGVFAIVVQVLVAGLLAVQPAAAAGADEFSVICTHDGGALALAADAGKGSPGGSSKHHCPACCCPQHGTLFSPPLASGIVLAAARSEPLPLALARTSPVHGAISPYASRAPPRLI